MKLILTSIFAIAATLSVASADNCKKKDGSGCSKKECSYAPSFDKSSEDHDCGGGCGGKKKA